MNAPFTKGALVEFAGTSLIVLISISPVTRVTNRERGLILSHRKGTFIPDSNGI